MRRRRSARGALGGDDRADLGERSRVQHVPRLDPAAPRGDDAELHLPAEHLGAVAVAVDRHGGAGGNGAARERAVQVEVRRRAVDFDDRAGLDGGREQRGRSRARSRGGAARCRLVGCVMIVTSGCFIAADVAAAAADRAPCPARSCSDASTMSNCSRILSGKSSRPSGRMSTSQPCRIAMSG